VQPAILLLHERDELHHQAVDFETFFATTPPELIKMGLYQVWCTPPWPACKCSPRCPCAVPGDGRAALRGPAPAPLAAQGSRAPC
jgi:hypothetical protein